MVVLVYCNCICVEGGALDVFAHLYNVYAWSINSAAKQTWFYHSTAVLWENLQGTRATQKLLTTLKGELGCQSKENLYC